MHANSSLSLTLGVVFLLAAGGCSSDAGQSGSDASSVDDGAAAGDAVAPDAGDGSEGSAGPDASEAQDASVDGEGVDAAPSDADARPSDSSWPPARSGCNGHEELCDRPFDEVVFPATHNSMSNAEDDWGIPNQNLNLRSQLRDGIRGFLLDVYDDRGTLKLCHAICNIGQRDLLDAFEEFADFLTHNPGEVISFLIEDYISADQLAGALEESGLARWAIVQRPGDPWPTLGELIAADTRLLVTTQDAGPPPEIVHNLWSLAWDTDYTFASVEEFDCGRNRGSAENSLFLVNHWLSAPAALPEYGPIANEYSVLMERVEACRQQWDRLPTFLAVDYYDAGDLFEVVDVLNGVAPARE